MIHFLQVYDSRIGVELLEYVICSRILRQLRDRPVLIGGVTEDDRARRTRCCASRRELIRLEDPFLGGRSILCLPNSLHAESALFHHAFATHCYVRIELPVQWLRERVLRPRRLSIPEPVEVANLVRTVV